MSEENKNSGLKKYSDAASLYITEHSVQWVAAMPLLLTGIMPLLVFIARLFSEGPFMPFHILDPLRIPFLIFAGITAMMKIYLAAVSHRKPADIIKENIPVILFAAFLLCMLISVIVVGIPRYDDPFNELGIYENEGHLMYISFFVVFFFCASCIELTEIKTAVIRTFVLISFSVAVFSLIDLYIVEIPSFHYMWDGCMPGVFNNPNHYGYYLTVMTMLSTGMLLYEKSTAWQITGLVSAVAHCAVLVLNDTFGCYLAVWAGFLFFIVTGIIVFRKFPLKILIPAGMLILFSLVLTTWQGSMSDNFVNLGNDVTDIASNSENSGLAGTARWVLWQTAAEGILESPVFGQGVEGWADILLERSHTGIHAHNEYLQYALFFGIPALICYVGGIFAVFLRGLKNRRIMDGYTLMALAAAFGYCVSAFFGNPKYYTAPFFFAVLGLGYSCLRGISDAQKKNDAGDHSSAANS